MTPPIEQFVDEYFFLSNFYKHPITYEDIYYQHTEAAFQAAKTLDPVLRRKISEFASPGKAKRAGRKLVLRDGWEEMKVQVMEDVLRLKFADPFLRSRLLATGDAELIEGNNWGDTVWGSVKTYNGEWTGQNLLGKLLMKLRSEYAQAK